MILIGIGFYFLFRKGDWSKVVDIKNNVSVWGLVAVLALFTISQLLMIIRWYLLLIPIKTEIQLRSVFRIAINAILLNQIAPGKVGYPTKAYFLKQAEDIPISRAIPSLVGEVFLDYFITGIFLVIAVWLGGYMRSLIQLLRQNMNLGHIWLIPVSILISLLIYFILKRKLASSSIFRNMAVAFRSTRQRTDIIAKSITITIVALFIWFVCDYLLLLSLGYKLPLDFLIFVGAFTNIIVLIAPLPGGLGVREISGAYLFKLFYNLGEIAVIMVLLSRLFSLLSLLILYGYDGVMRLILKMSAQPERISDAPIVTHDLKLNATEN